MPNFAIDAVRYGKRESGVYEEVGAMAGPEVIWRAGAIAPFSAPGLKEGALDDDQDHVNDQNGGPECGHVEVVFLRTLPTRVSWVPACHCCGSGPKVMRDGYEIKLKATRKLGMMVRV